MIIGVGTNVPELEGNPSRKGGESCLTCCWEQTRARCRALELASCRRVGPVLQRSHTARCDALSHTDSSLVEQQQEEEGAPPRTRFDEAAESGCASLEAGAGVTLGTMRAAPEMEAMASPG